MIKKLFGGLPKKNRYAIDLPTDSAVPAINNQVIATDMTMEEFSRWATNGISSAGMAVTEKTAMAVSAVYACVSLIGGAIASMPIGVYQRDGDSRESIKNDIWWLLNEQPTADYSSATLWESLMASKLLHGDGFAVIKRAGIRSEKIVGLEWHASPRVSVLKDKSVGLIYRVVDLDGAVNNYAAQDVLHFPGPGFNGLRGMSQLQYSLRTSAGIALAADTYSAKFFENGARPDFAIIHPANPTPEQVNTLRETWYSRHQGASAAHLPAILAGGMDVKELTMNAEDAQLISTRQFQIEDIARIFRVPPHMIGHTQASTSWGTGIEQMSLAFIKFTLMRHMTVIEKELNRKLWPNRQNVFAEFNPSGLERGDYKTRMDGYRVAIGRAGEPGWMTINEVRKLENLPPVDGGDLLNSGANDAKSADKTAGAQ